MAVTSFLHCSTSPSISSFSKPKLNHSSPSYKPIRINMLKNESSWAALNNDVEAHIENALLGRRPASVYDPMHHLIFEAPRSMAPALCIAACEIVGGYKEQAITTASALHLMHAAAYTHENLPLSDKTRPKSLGPRAFGPGIELLTGDGILPLGYELLTRLGDDGNSHNPRHVLRVIMEISHAMGPEGMVEGQYQEKRHIRSDSDESYEVGWIFDVCKKKEGGLYACGAACGAILGGGSDEEVEILRRYGLYVGMIHGMMLHKTEMEENKLVKMMEELRCLALKELESLQNRNVEAIHSFIDQTFPILRI